MKKIRTGNCRMFRFSLTGILMAGILLTLSLTACAGKKNFKASDEMISEIEVYKSVEGLEKLDDKLKAEFAETINAKYDVNKIKDLTGTGTMEIVATVTSEELGGLEAEMSMGGDVGFQVDKTNELSYMNMDMKISVMGMNIPMTVEEYIDSKNHVTYTKGSALGETGDWEKETTEETEGTGENEEKKRDFLISEEDIIAIYQDPESKAYAVEVQLSEDSASSGLLNGVESTMGDTTESSFELSKVTTIATLDEGLAFAGIYMDFGEALKDQSESETQFKTATAVIKLKTYNAGDTITIPREVLDAKEKDAGGDDGLFNMF
ncbi:MAG: hypothetical protein Q4D81_13535 [Eubacteriales bacterium]|nr:hypothetical protein [Eubacteriales bacterium]